MNSRLVQEDEASARTARAGMAVLLILAACVFAIAVVGTRSLSVGTDTERYALFYQWISHGVIDTSFEPGFVLLARGFATLDLGWRGEQAAFFLCLLLTVLIATRKYRQYLSQPCQYRKFLTVSLALLFVSPVFVNASINAIRQGLAAFLVFAALLSFQRRQWWEFLIYAAVASSLHRSSLLYFAFAPLLLLSARTQMLIGMAAITLYCSGVSEVIVKRFFPTVFSVVNSYGAGVGYDRGIRLDFAAFSVLWYLIPYLAGSTVRASVREKIRETTSTYLILLLPFFAIGWGAYSNRFLLPAWLAASLMVAAIVCGNRNRAMRSTAFASTFLLGSCLCFFYLVKQGIVV